MEHLTTFFGYFFLASLFFLLGAVILTFILFVWKRTDMNDHAKIAWTLFFLFVPIISIPIYLLPAYKRKANY